MNLVIAIPMLASRAAMIARIDPSVLKIPLY